LSGETLGETELQIDFDQEELVLLGGYSRKGPLIRFWGWVGIIGGSVALIAAIVGFVCWRKNKKLKQRLN
jgi:hypothetical protein